MRVPLGADGACMCRIVRVRRSPIFRRARCWRARRPPAQLENRIVLVGSTAPGLTDLRVTPFSNTFPGVEIHAHLIAGMLDGTTRSHPAVGERRAPAGGTRAGRACWRLCCCASVRWSGWPPRWRLLAGLLAAYAAAWSRFWVVPMAAPMLTVVGAVCAQHRLRFFCRDAQQTADDQAVRPVCAARTGGRNEPGPGALHDGRPVARHERAVFRHSRLHRFFRETAARRTGRSAQRLSCRP